MLVQTGRLADTRWAGKLMDKPADRKAGSGQAGGKAGRQAGGRTGRLADR